MSRFKPDLLRSMLLTFALYFAFRGQLHLLQEATFYHLSQAGFWTVLGVTPLLLGYNAYRHWVGAFELPDLHTDLPYLLHPRRQWLVLLLMPLLVFVEEFLFRVCLLGSLQALTGTLMALVISALLFVVAHEQPLRLNRSNGILLLYGLVFGAVYILSGASFMAAFLVHLAVNVYAWVINAQLIRRAGGDLLPLRLAYLKRILPWPQEKWLRS